MSKHSVDNSLRCSFCYKSQNKVGKLISSPSDHPRAHICDECITVCATILADDRPEVHRLLSHPLASSRSGFAKKP